MAFDAQATTQLTDRGKTTTVKIKIRVNGPSDKVLKISVRQGRGEWKVPFELFDKVLNDNRREAKRGNTTVSQQGDKTKVVVGGTELLMPKWYMEQVARTLKNLYGMPNDADAWDGGLLPDDMD